MKIQNKRTKILMPVIAIITILLFSTSTSPAFATTYHQYPTYNCASAIPNGWDIYNDAYASASTSGSAYTYAQAPYGYSEVADAYMNMDQNGNGCSTPELTNPNGNTLWYGYDISYNVSITNQGSGTSQYTDGAQLWEDNSGTWYRLDSCIISPVTSTSSNDIGSMCSTSTGSSNTYATVGITESYATGPAASGDNIVDAKTNPSTVNELVLCDQLCGL